MPRVLIVGGGILGTAHALEAVERGFDVTHLEAEPEPRGSTARSPGALHFSRAASGLDLELSLRAAESWNALGVDADHPAFFRRTGSHAVASTQAELEVLGSLLMRPDADDRGWRLLDRDQARAINPAMAGNFVASLYSDIDAVVEPRAALDRLRSRLAGRDNYRFLGGREVRDFGSDSVTDSSGRVHRGDLVVLCPGTRSDLTSSVLRQPSIIRRIQIQVAQTEPLAATMTAPVSDVVALVGTRLRDSTTELPGSSDTTLGDMELRLTCVQRPGGALTVGEARVTEEPFDFDVAERPTKMLLAHLETIIGRPAPVITRQWTGTIRECVDGRLWFRDDLDETVAMVTGTDQRGITLAPVIAADTFDWLQHGLDSGATRPEATGA